MQPLEERGFHPIEIVDTSKKEAETFQLTDPEFLVHLKSDQNPQEEVYLF